MGESTATSLLELGAVSTDRDALLCHLLTQLGERAVQWRAGCADLESDYRARSVTIGQRVRADLPGDREVIGTATGIDEAGRLSIDTGSGITTVAAGDIVHLRGA